MNNFLKVMVQTQYYSVTEKKIIVNYLREEYYFDPSYSYNAKIKLTKSVNRIKDGFIMQTINTFNVVGNYKGSYYTSSY